MNKSFEYMGAPPKNNDVPKKKQTSRSKEEPKNGEAVTRRTFLKLGSAFITALVAGREVDDFLTGKKEAGRGEEISKSENNESIPKEPTPDNRGAENEAEIEPDMDYAESLSDILDFDKEGSIRLTPETMKRVREYWKERYKKDPKMRASLKYAYREMGCWQKHLKEAFRRNSVPEHMVYLAIPESHWNVKKMISEAEAVGYYQIRRSTGKNMGLKIGTVIDERMDPIKGADLCARYLKEWHDKANGGRKDDRQEYWSLALAAYNGSFAQTYINECAKEKREVSGWEFLKTIEDKLNKIKDDLRENKLKHIVGRLESLGSIAKKYGISHKEFQRVNALKETKLKRGQSLLIPTVNLGHEAKKRVFAAEISGFSENLNYPEKFNAVRELIEERFVTEQKPEIDFKLYTIQQEADVVNPNYHTVKKGENPSMLSRKYGVSIKKIAKGNKSINLNKIKPGDILSIPGAKVKGKNSKAKSLITEAIRNGIPIKDMGFKNQHVRDWQAALPNGTELRA